MRNSFNLKAVTRLVSVAAIAAMAAASSVEAAAIIITPSTAIRSDNGFSVGVRFNVGASDVTVTDAGAVNIDISGVPKTGGLANATNWRLYNSSGGVIASTTIAAGTGAGQQFAYQSITPVVLTAGQTYTLGLDVIGGLDAWYSNTPAAGVVLSTDFNTYTSVYGSTGLIPNTDDQPNTAYVGPNFLYAIPEPTSLALLGPAMLAAMRRRRA